MFYERGERLLLLTNIRRSPLETKLQLATEFVSGFNLPNQSDMIAQCYAALDSEIDNAVKRMKNFFLNEGILSFQHH